MPVRDVTGGAPPDPGSEFGGSLTVVRGAAHVAEVAGDGLPPGAVARGVPSKGMRDFVQQRLMDLIVVEPGCKVARDCDALALVVTQPCASLRMVEVETPRVIEVRTDERFTPHSHAFQIGHEIRIEPARDIGGEARQRRSIGSRHGTDKGA